MQHNSLDLDHLMQCVAVQTVLRHPQPDQTSRMSMTRVWRRGHRLQGQPRSRRSSSSRRSGQPVAHQPGQTWTCDAVDSSKTGMSGHRCQVVGCARRHA
jgi:hypothetical protein